MSISLVILTAIFFGLILYANHASMFHIISLIGIIALIIPLILSISSKYNIGSKLDSGEVRKSIVVSLTIIYIIFLVMSFEQTLNDEQETGGTYFLNATYDEKINDTAHKVISIDINSTSEGVLQVIPVTATANVSNGTVQITPHISEKTGTSDGGDGMIPLTGDNGTSLPADAISSFTKNFLWVYALIISFYFGSRIWEDRADKSTFNDYISNLMKDGKCPLDPLDIAKARFSLGEIGQREYKDLKEYLEENPTVTIKNAYIKKPQNQTNKSVILCIWNGTDTNIKVESVTIFDKGSGELKKINIIGNIIEKKKYGVVDVPDITIGREQIGIIKIETKSTEENITGGEYSDLIMQDQIEEINDT